MRTIQKIPAVRSNRLIAYSVRATSAELFLVTPRTESTQPRMQSLFLFYFTMTFINRRKVNKSLHDFFIYEHVKANEDNEIVFYASSWQKELKHG